MRRPEFKIEDKRQKSKDKRGFVIVLWCYNGVMLFGFAEVFKYIYPN
jgi:hypothetical protein